VLALGPRTTAATRQVNGFHLGLFFTVASRAIDLLDLGDIFAIVR
jgi:hypothetical protein